MKFSENWLRTYVNPTLDSDALGHALTMAGLEVEALETVAPPFEKIFVGHVLSVEKHPDADRLNVCKVDIGEGEPLQIVCGAPNVHAGAKAPCALVGANLPKIQIKKAKVRGMESFGMLCSEAELGLADESSGLLLLPSDAPVGMSIREYLDLDDKLFTLKLTPNRSDCLSVAGVAREVAAITGTDIQLPEQIVVEAEPQDQLLVKVREALACPRYCGRIVRGVDAKAATPSWMKRRIERSGLRSISALVDITNYVLLELGQPLHAFDLQKISDGIHVRYAEQGEQLVLLNDQEVKLDKDMLVIADGRKALALAGIMGGAESAVSDDTTDIFLESAFFDPDVIAGKARRLGLSSDSSYRFERGVDFANTRNGIERATKLILDICGGKPGPVTESIATLPTREPVMLRLERANRVLGLQITSNDIAGLLQNLQFEYSMDGDRFQVIPPSYRFDISIEEDLIEEIARIYGYDNIPAVTPQASLPMTPVSEFKRGLSELRRILVGRDYQEIVTYSFVDASWEKDFTGGREPIPLRNPISSQMEMMRSTLVGGLVDCLQFNLNRKESRVRVFEIGRCFEQGADGYDQTMRLGGLSYGSVNPEQWAEKMRNTDFYDVKADVEALLWPIIPGFKAANHPAFHPGQAAEVLVYGKVIGMVGMLHPAWQQKYDLPLAPGLFELDVTRLMTRSVPKFSEIPKFPPVRRDLAVIVDENIIVQDILDELDKIRPEIVTEIAIFDVYRGKGIDSCKKSLAFRVLMQDTQKTLTDQEIDSVIAQFTQHLATRFNAQLRA